MTNGFRVGGRKIDPLSKPSLILCLFLYFCVVVAGCSRSSTVPQIKVAYKISPQPTRIGPAVITFSLRDASDKLLTGDRIQVEADMSHPGMAPVFAPATETSPGTYTANLNFEMAGDWVVILHVVEADGKISTASLM